MNRSKIISTTRPVIETNDTSFSEEEKFQNNSLRQILKFQNELIIAWFDFQVQRFKVNLKEDSQGNLKNLISKNTSLQAELKGLIMGQFTLDEYRTYTNYSKDFGKRIIQMAIQRYLSQR